VDLQLTDRVVLVAGSSRGIGKAVAATFLREGCRVAIAGREPGPLAEARDELEAAHAGRVLAYPGDHTDPAVIRTTLQQLRERWGAPECVVANIGTGRGKPGWQIGEADWQPLFEANLWGSVRLVTEVLPGMVEARRGSVVFVASITGVESMPAPLPYSAAKAALLNYAKNLARQVGPHNVRVNCVAPGNILFPGGSWEKHLRARKDEVTRTIQTEVPLQRFGRPEEIADLVVFLSSDRAAFITGACVVADGGQTRSL
jgi:3-oxoacyl-[acyl-carrier protein] reductase